jgi:diguanylate cyclase (GGDEF)-like protein
MEKPLPWADSTPGLTLWSAILFCCFSALLAALYLLPSVASLLCLVPVLSYLMLGQRMGMVYSVGWPVLGMAILMLRPGSTAEELSSLGATLLGVGVLSHLFEAKREALIQALRRTAALDPVTGLHNHLYLESIFSQLTRPQRGKPATVSLMLIDVDQHDDAALVHVARRIEEVCRGSDWAFRFGDARFCVLVPWVTQVQGQQIADRLKAGIEAGESHRVHPRIGLVRWPDDAGTLAGLHQAAARHIRPA